ncbi:MAG: hypothetical protein WCO55_03610 [Candidatus Falkowbacteria bacterium]
MSKIKLSLVAMAAVVGVLIWGSQEGLSKSGAYYAGDAFEYNYQLYVATANTGSAEIFRLNGSALEPLIKFNPVKEADMMTNTFNDIILNEEGGRLYAYASSGNVLYKYNLADFNSPVLVTKVASTNWDWFGRLDRANGHVVTIGSKGVKIWSEDLQVIDNYAVTNNTNPYNIRLSSDGKFIFNIKNDKLEIFDRQFRAVVRSAQLLVNTASANRRVAYDAKSNMVYVMDDQSLQQISLTGNVYKSLKHDSRFGYDASLSGDGEYLYISNGTTVAKLNQRNFQFVRAFEDRDLKIDGSWAMGINPVMTDMGEKVVVFNNSNILVLDSNMNLLAVAKAGSATPKALVNEAVSLSVDKAHATVYAEIGIRGTGFWPNEQVIVNFADRSYRATADKNGRFFKVLPVPAVAASRVDIKAIGTSSQANYSVGFTIDR